MESEDFAEEVKQKLGLAAKHRDVVHDEPSYLLREISLAYNTGFGAKNTPLSVDNTIFWDMNYEASAA